MTKVFNRPSVAGDVLQTPWSFIIRSVTVSPLSSKSSKYYNFQTVRARELKCWEKIYHPLCVTCHMSHVMGHTSCVTCHVSHVTCHMSPATYHWSHDFFFLYFFFSNFRCYYFTGHLVLFQEVFQDSTEVSRNILVKFWKEKSFITLHFF